MSEDATKTRITKMLKTLEEDRVEMDGLELDDLKDAMSHPKAPEILAKWMPHEATAVKQGEPAPDFTLPYLPGHGVLPGHGEEGESMTLSSHFGKRPVGLIFGSYT